MLRETFSAAKTQASIGRRGGASQPIAQTSGDLLARPWAGPEQSEDEKEQQRFIDCQTYLEKPDVLPRLLRYRLFMHVFADARIPVLQRTGQARDIQQARRLQETGSRSYLIFSLHGLPIG